MLDWLLGAAVGMGDMAQALTRASLTAARGAVTWAIDHNLSAQGWAAIAALFSALSSLVMMRIQRSNLLESVRPELVLVKWSRHEPSPDDREDRLWFRVKNVGRGAAFHVALHSRHYAGEHLTASLGLFNIPPQFPIVAAGEELASPVHMLLSWDHVKPYPFHIKRLHITVRASSWDSRNRYHETRYRLIVMDLASTDGLDPFPTDIAPHVMLESRHTITRLAQSVRFRAWIAGIATRAQRILPGKAFLRRT